MRTHLVGDLRPIDDHPVHSGIDLVGKEDRYPQKDRRGQPAAKSIDAKLDERRHVTLPNARQYGSDVVIAEKAYAVRNGGRHGHAKCHD